MSFRYYDPIIAIISENISHNQRETLALRQRLAHKLHYDGDVKRLILTATGVFAQKNKEPLTFKYSALNKRPPIGVNHHNSHHTMSLQRSKYICLDDNTTKQFVLDNQTKKKLMAKQQVDTEQIHHDLLLEKIS